MKGYGFDARIGRLMIVMTYISDGLLEVGVVLMLANGISPLDGAPTFDIHAIPDALKAGAPVGFLWLGLIAVIATPLVRVAVSAVGFAREGQWRMVAIGAGILLVIAVGIASSLVLEH